MTWRSWSGCGSSAQRQCPACAPARQVRGSVCLNPFVGLSFTGNALPQCLLSRASLRAGFSARQHAFARAA